MLNGLPNFITGAIGLFPTVAADLPQRHLFNKTDIDGFIPCITHQIDDFIVVTPFQYHRIQFDALKASPSQAASTPPEPV